jgi:[protein-PII] uridylyltransferase|tara:strand:+ start:288 stop:2588 length:2301 start_codon:yes stop_codon:yes gene_type:complete
VTPFDTTDLLGDRSLRGPDFCRALSDRIDGFLAEVFDSAGPPAGTALVAVGGYGRREQCPGSDVDIVLVHRPGLDMAEVAERVWYPLWDAGLKLGHQVGTLPQLLQVASEHLDTATSLLAARPVAGDATVADELAAAALAQWSGRSRRHLDDLQASVAERHARFGEVAFLLEPDLKESRGGLRDVHSLLWVEQATVPILRESESAGLAAAAETLLTVRVELHRLTGQRADRLLLELQDDVAAALDLVDADVLMAEVAAAARTIAWTGEGAARRTTRAARRSGPLGAIANLRRREVAPGLVLDDGRLALTAQADLADPLLALRCARVAAEHDAYLQRGSLERLVENAPALDVPWSDEAREMFVALLATGPSAIPVIEDLDHVGLFVQLVPEWEPCRSRPQRNAYHRFTVDRHLMEAAAEASRLVDRVDRPDLLLVGALFHDIGKGYPGDHTEVGVDLLQTIATRMGFDADDVETLVAMVRHHLLLPDVATRRDLDDDGTIASVADAVGSSRLLHLLGALTEADSIATGPSAWSSWKGGLVDELVSRVSHVLAGGDVGEVVGGSFPDAGQRLLLADGSFLVRGEGRTLTVVANDRTGTFSKVAGVLSLNGADVLGASAHSENGRALSVFRVGPAPDGDPDWTRIADQIRLALAGRLALSARLGDRSRTYRPVRLSARPARPRMTVDNLTSATATVLEVTCPDGVGVLYRITRAFAELDLDIVRAHVQTLGSDVVDAFYVRNASGDKITDVDHLAEIELSVLRWVAVDF